MRASRAVLLLLLTGCTASWGRLVRYSTEPAPPTEDLVVGLYAVVLQRSAWPGRDTVVVTGTLPALAAVTTGSGPSVPGYWADTLKQEVLAALRDSAFGRPVPPDIIEAAAMTAGLQLVTAQPAETLRAHRRRGEPPVPRVTLSWPGFNRDSTIAVVDVSVWCGFLCGSGETLYLARRPGFRWRVWMSRLRWVS